MRYLQRAYNLAEARGYFRFPEVLSLESKVPEWFVALGSDAGCAAFEARQGFRVPKAMREFYQCLPLACFLEATIDGEVFLTNLAALIVDELPPIVYWSTGPHLVFSFHNHSGMMLAARSGMDDPLTFCGFEDEQQPLGSEESPPEIFSTMMFNAVDVHEARLDYWQGVYERRHADPAELARLGNVEWIRSMPGMAQRLQ